MTMTLLLFFACAGLFMLHQLGAFNDTSIITTLNGYLDPLLLMPILLQLVLQEQILLYKRLRSYRLPRSKVLQLTISVAFIAEVLFPALSADFTADTLDVACYFMGSAFFLAFMNRNMLPIRTRSPQPVKAPHYNPSSFPGEPA